MKLWFLTAVLVVSCNALTAESPQDAGNNFYRELIGRGDLLAHASLRTTASINAQSRSRFDTSKHLANKEVIYDPEKDAARFLCSGSAAGVNQIVLPFESKSNGHLVWTWDYFGNADWGSNRARIRTHKFSMMGCEDGTFKAAGNDRRRLEQRYHYGGGPPGTWLIDIRPYHVGVDAHEEGRGFDRMTPYRVSVQRTGEWYRHVCDVNFNRSPAVFSYRTIDTAGNIQTIYKEVVCRDLVANGGLNRFSPGWWSTSQPKLDAPITHGWLRNPVVLWSAKDIDIEPLLIAPKN